MGIYKKGFMTDKKLKEDLELLKTDELIDIILDQSKQLEKHKEKESKPDANKRS